MEGMVAKYSGLYSDTIEFARRLRIHAIEMAHYSKESHVASALSMCDIIAVLYGRIMRIQPDIPENPNRDRFILSKGHACSAVYAALAELGFFPVSELNRQCTDGAMLSGHMCSMGEVPGAEASTGSLGHGCCIAAGIALAGKLKGRKYRVYTILGDGECDEGSVWEMALFAYQQRLSNLYVIVDANGMQAMGFCKNVADHIDLMRKWESFGWETVEVNGHNHDEIYRAITGMETDKPKCIIADTVKGKGVSFMENELLWHYHDPQGDDYIKALEELKG